MSNEVRKMSAIRWSMRDVSGGLVDGLSDSENGQTNIIGFLYA